MNNEQRIGQIERDLARLTARVPIRQAQTADPVTVEWSTLPVSESVGKWVDGSGSLAIAGPPLEEGHAEQVGLVIRNTGTSIVVAWSGEVDVPAASYVAGRVYYLSPTTAGDSVDLTTSPTALDGYIRRAVALCVAVNGATATLQVIGRTAGSIRNLVDVDLTPQTPSTDYNLQGYLAVDAYGTVRETRRSLQLQDLTVTNGGSGNVYVEPVSAQGTSLYPFTASPSDNGKVLTWVSNIGGGGGAGWVAAAASAGTVAWSSVTGTPTNLSGYGITDPVVLTSGSYANPAWITSLAASKLTGGSNAVATNTTDTTNAAALTISGTFDNWTLTLNEKRPRFNAKWIQGNLVDTVAPTTNGDLMMWHAASSSVKWVRGLTTRGDLLYGDPSANYGRLPVGTAGQVLTTDGTDVLWGAMSGLTVGFTGASLTLAGASISLSSKTWLLAVIIGAGGGGQGGAARTTAGFIAGSSGASPTTQLYLYQPGCSGATGNVLVVLINVSGLSTATVSAGSAGTGGAAATDGNDGGSTTLTVNGDVYTAAGGLGGRNGSLSAADVNSASSKSGSATTSMMLGSYVGRTSKPRSPICTTGSSVAGNPREILQFGIFPGMNGVTYGNGGAGGASDATGQAGSNGVGGAVYYATW